MKLSKEVSIWIIGNKGMLGQQLCRLLEQEGIPFVGTDLEVSIMDPAALLTFGKEHVHLSVNLHAATQRSKVRHPLSPIPWIVNCAAYTAVDRAEEDPETCFALNAEGPKNIARVAEELGAGLIQISTDYVFDGVGIRDSSGNLRPYREEDPVNPVGVYGKSKAAGEQAVQQSCSRVVILRTAWLYGKYGNNFVSTMLRLMNEREVVRVVNDQRGTPTWAADLSRAILAILQAPRPQFGIFQYTNGGECTWYEFASEIYRLGRELGLFSRECRVEPISTDQYPTKAKRPQYSVLSKEKIQRVYGVPVPPWQESLKRFLKELNL